MKRLFLLLIIAFSAAGCKSLLPEDVEIVTLGIVPESITIPAGAGEDGVRLIADRDYSIDIIRGAEWLSVGLAARDSLSFSFKVNDGFRRSAIIRVSADGREDELLVKQEGPFQEILNLSEHTVEVGAEGNSVSLRVYSNQPSDYFSVSASSDEVIQKLSLDSYILSFVVAPTTNRDKRTHVVTVSYIDGWEELISDSVSIVQEAYD